MLAESLFVVLTTKVAIGAIGQFLKQTLFEGEMLWEPNHHGGEGVYFQDNIQFVQVPKMHKFLSKEEWALGG
jgi:hypothetical protein